MFEEISIIGCGLIGSSILRAVEKKNISKKTIVYDKSREVLSYLKNNNLNISITSDIKIATKNADLIIIATPLSSYKEILLSIKDSLKKNVILTDTGSAKKEVNKIIDNLNLKDLSWIASHPIAGTEDSGPQAGFAELFENRWCIISPSKNSKEDDVQKLKNFWEKIGSKIKVMTFEDHDYILALTSHLPHAIAYNIVKTAISNDDKFKQDVIQYSAGGLRDFTRIAASDPVMWRDIFIDNSENILKILDKFSHNLDEMKMAIREKNGEKLIKIFSSTKDIRKEIIKAGQDTEKPDFGRKKS
ncbi:MAG: prephenate dehydrogenase/cyclohexadieny/prephenate dehydrogenase [Pelagibacterales bacterium]|jgi:cyclohexadieny/prephenate dehydrogenase|nr:prephenate dehydrogenase/cyclohexadieny/prephenate dehydrogenase [Pelagibacterales bacterium]